MNRDRKDKLDALLEGRRDALNGWKNKKRAVKDRAYAVGTEMGECEYQQFLAGPPNPPPGYVPPPLPEEIQSRFLATLAEAEAKMLKSEKIPGEVLFSALTTEDLQRSPITDLPFAMIAALG